MAGRHSLFAVVLFALIVHSVAITQTILPAQDGLKFIRIARLFHSQPWTDVVRGSDTHPLYPALIALTEPVVAAIAGPGPDTWRLAAQIVAVFASVGLIFPIYGLTRSLFDKRIACMAGALAVLLPRTAELGHDTLSDSLGLLCTFSSLWLGARAIRRGDWKSALASGLAAGLGYLARPEVIVVPFAIGATWLIGLVRDSRLRTVARGPVLAVLLLSAFSVVGSYAMVKGEISEKLAFRYNISLRPTKPAIRRSVPPAVRGLDSPRWDFSPKEETDRIPIRSWQYAVVRIIGKWWEELCWLFAVMTAWGIARQRYIRGLCVGREADTGSGDVEAHLLLIFTMVHTLALVRHSALLGYLSGRHIMALVYASLPWAAAGTFVCGRGISVARRWSPRQSRIAAIVAGGLLVGGVDCGADATESSQSSQPDGPLVGRPVAGRSCRPQRAGSRHTRLGQVVSNHPGYDYWHVRQALADSHLSYIVVGLDELDAESSRAKTLRALLAYTAVPLKEFPANPGDRTAGVRLYRFQRPGTWEGLVP